MSTAGKSRRASPVPISVSVFVLMFAFIASTPPGAFADSEFDRLFSARKYREALDYAESKLPNDRRTPALWVRIGQANEAQGFSEKALACYMVAWRLESNEYEALMGIARIYNGTGQPDNALSMAENALKINFTAEASWEYARACIALGRAADAKQALEKVISADPGNAVATRELGGIYCNDREFAAAIPLLRRSYQAKADGDAAFRLGWAFAETGAPDSALAYLLLAIDGKANLAGAAAPGRSPILYRQAANAARQRKLFADAAAHIRRYIELKPDDAEAHRDLGDFMYEQKNLDAALASYKAAIKLDPKLKGFHKRYAEIVIAKGQTNEVVSALTAVIENGDADAGTYTTLGTIYHSRKQYREAMDMFTQALKLEPSNLDAITALARSQAASGNITAAVITYEQAVMMHPGADREYKALGDLYMQQNKGAEALAAYARYLEKVPGDGSLAATVGRLYFEEKKYAEAAKFLSLSRAGDPALLLMYAEASLNAGDFKNAIVALEDLRGRKPRVANIDRVLVLLGGAYEKDGKPGQAALAYAEYAALPGAKDPETAYKAAFMQEKENRAAAIRIYEANIKAFPDDVRNCLRLGLLYLQSRETQAKAAPLLQRSAAAADENPKLWLEIAGLYRSMDRDEDELEAWRRYARVNPQDIEANRRMGALLMRKGDFNNAMINLEIANTMSPNDPGVLSLLARGYVRTQRNKEAIELLERAKQAKPDDPDIRYQLYELLVLTKQPQQALEEIKALAGMKSEARYLLPYGKALIAQGKVKEAEAIVDRIIEKDPDNVEAMMLNAAILRANKNYDDAIELYKTVSDIMPDYAPAYYERAETFVQASKPVRAESLYTRALKADPQYALAELGLAKLYKSRKQTDLYNKHLENARKLAPDNDLVIEEVRKSAEGK